MQIKLISTGSELSLMLQMRSTCMSKRPALVMRNLSSVFLFFSLYSSLLLPRATGRTRVLADYDTLMAAPLC